MVILKQDAKALIQQDFIDPAVEGHRFQVPPGSVGFCRIDDRHRVEQLCG